MQQDVSYGLRQLADVALKALSPGINDPTTAQDAIFHAAAVLAELLRRDPPPRVLLEALHLLTESLNACGLDDRSEPLADQARLTVAGCEAADLLPADIELVRRAFAKRFGPSASA